MTNKHTELYAIPSDTKITARNFVLYKEIVIILSQPLLCAFEIIELFKMEHYTGWPKSQFTILQM